MAEPLTGEFRIEGLTEAARDIKRLKGQIGEMKDTVGTLASPFNTAANAMTSAVVIVRAAIDAFVALKDATIEVGQEFERQASIFNRFSGDISDASRRVNGLISDIDLMIASNKAAAAGLSLTSEQFATLAVRASEWGAATGQDAREAFEKLMQAVATGEEGPLKELGISLEGLTTVQERQEHAIRELTSGWEDATSEADTLAGKIAALDTKFENLKTEMFQAVEDAELLDTAFDSLVTSVEHLFDSFGMFDEGGDSALSHLEEFAIRGSAYVAAFSAQMELAMKLMEELGNAARALQQGDFQAAGRAVNNFMDGQQDLGPGGFGAMVNRFTDLGRGAAMANKEKREIEGQLQRNGSQQRRPQNSRDRDELGPAPGEGLAYDLQNEIATIQLERQKELEEQIAAQRAKAAEARRKDDEDALALANQVTEQAYEQLRLYNAQTTALREQAEARRQEIKLARKAQMAQTAINEAGSLFVDSIQLAVSGQEDLGSAMLHMLDEWSKQFALQETYKGIAALAEGVGNVIMNQPHSSAKFAEAAMHFGLAAVLGGVSAAIPNQGGGAAAGTSAPAGPPQNSGGGGSTYVVNINAPVAEPLLGRQQERARRAAENRFGP